METLMELVNIAKIEDKQNVKEITLNVGNELKELGFNKISDKNLLIQTTSIWTLNPNISEQEVEDFCPKNFVNNFEFVMDIIYNPIQTPLLKIASQLGKKTITGDNMLLYQAAEQFKIWTKKKAPIEVMRKALNDNLV